MIKSVKKLISTELQPYQYHIYFNMYLLKSIFFGCGIILITNNQEKELKRIYEAPILLKLELSKKLPYYVLYMCKTAGGIGLLKLLTAIVMAKVKQYVGNMKIQSNVAQNIKLNKDYTIYESGYSTIPIQIKAENQFWK